MTKSEILDLPIFIKINNKIISKSNYRQTKGASWARYKEFEKLVAIEVKKNKLQNWDSMLFNKDYGILIVANSKVDVGNYNKSILDALEGIIYKNDRQVKISISIQENKLNKDTFIIGILPFENNIYDNYFIIDKLVKTLYDKILI